LIAQVRNSASYLPRVAGAGISATRPSTRAAMSNRVASTSPCTSRGCGRSKYHIDNVATTATTTPTMIAGRRVGEFAHFFDSALGFPVP